MRESDPGEKLFLLKIGHKKTHHNTSQQQPNTGDIANHNQFCLIGRCPRILQKGSTVGSRLRLAVRLYVHWRQVINPTTDVKYAFILILFIFMSVKFSRKKEYSSAPLAFHLTIDSCSVFFVLFLFFVFFRSESSRFLSSDGQDWRGKEIQFCVFLRPQSLCSLDFSFHSTPFHVSQN